MPPAAAQPALEEQLRFPSPARAPGGRRRDSGSSHHRQAAAWGRAPRERDGRLRCRGPWPPSGSRTPPAPPRSPTRWRRGTGEGAGRKRRRKLRSPRRARPRRDGGRNRQRPLRSAAPARRSCGLPRWVRGQRCPCSGCGAGHPSRGAEAGRPGRGERGSGGERWREREGEQLGRELGCRSPVAWRGGGYSMRTGCTGSGFGFLFLSFPLRSAGLRRGCGSSAVRGPPCAGRRGRGEPGQKGLFSCQPWDLIVCPVWQRRELLIGVVILKVTDRSLGTTSVRPGNEFCLQKQ